MKVWLTFLEWLEFLVTPLGLAVGLWSSLYLLLVQRLSFNLALAALLPALLSVEVYFALSQRHD